MSKAWPLVKLGEVLEKSQNWVNLDAQDEYKEVTVRLWGKGVTLRGMVTGSQIAGSRRIQVHSNQFILSRIDARNGAFGLIPYELENAVVSNDFPVFDIHQNRLLPKYLHWLSKTKNFIESCKSVSEGTTNRVRLKEDKFIQIEIPLPPLAEQQRIVAKIERLAGKIEEARKLYNQSCAEADILTRLYLNQLASSFSSIGQLKEFLINKPRNGWSANCDNADDGIAVLTLSAITGFNYNSSSYKKTSLAVNKNAHYWLNNGNLLITRSNTPELVGHAAIYNGIPNPCIYPDLMMKIVINEEKADTQFVWYWLQSQTVRKYIMENAKGTSPTMKKITQDTVMNIPFPVGIPIEKQRQIAHRLNALQKKIESLRSTKTQTTAELDALLPSILDQAFKGEL